MTAQPRDGVPARASVQPDLLTRRTKAWERFVRRLEVHENGKVARVMEAWERFSRRLDARQRWHWAGLQLWLAQQPWLRVWRTLYPNVASAVAHTFMETNRGSIVPQLYFEQGGVREARAMMSCWTLASSPEAISQMADHTCCACGLPGFLRRCPLWSVCDHKFHLECGDYLPALDAYWCPCHHGDARRRIELQMMLLEELMDPEVDPEELITPSTPSA